MIFLVVSLRRVAPNTSEQKSRSGLCEGVIRREATETEGLVIYIFELTVFRFQSETNEWSETARKLIQDITAIEQEEVDPPKLERTTKTVLNQETADNLEHKLNSESEISAICEDKNARTVSIEQLTADTEVPPIGSYLEGTELPSSHAMEGIDTENVVKELGEANSRVIELERRIGELEVELKSSKTAEKQAIEKISQLEDFVEQSKPKSPSKQGSGKTVPKRVPSSHGRTPVTPSRAAK